MKANRTYLAPYTRLHNVTYRTLVPTYRTLGISLGSAVYLTSPIQQIWSWHTQVSRPSISILDELVALLRRFRPASSAHPNQTPPRTWEDSTFGAEFAELCGSESYQGDIRAQQGLHEGQSVSRMKPLGLLNVCCRPSSIQYNRMYQVVFVYRRSFQPSMKAIMQRSSGESTLPSRCRRWCHTSLWWTRLRKSSSIVRRSCSSETMRLATSPDGCSSMPLTVCTCPSTPMGDIACSHDVS